MKDRDKQVVPETEKQIQYGVHKDNINPERLTEIAKIYMKVAGIKWLVGADSPEEAAEDMQRQLDYEFFGGIDMRYGSRLTGHTKLMSRKEWDAATGERIVKFYMNPNIGFREEDFEEGEKMSAQFDKAIGEYLQTQGVARQIMEF